MHMQRPLTAKSEWKASHASHATIPSDRLSRFLDQESFVNAIAPKGDLTKIGRAQFALLFRVADTTKRGLISWDDFTVFETLLKRHDADYWMAFQYFDGYVETGTKLSVAYEDAAIIQDTSRTTSSSKFSQRTLDLILSHLISNGMSFLSLCAQQTHVI